MGVWTRFRDRKGRSNGASIPATTLTPVSQVEPSDVQWNSVTLKVGEWEELLSTAIAQVQTRGTLVPLFLLAFRPTNPVAAAKAFVRDFVRFRWQGAVLATQCKLTEPLVLLSVIKWIWGRIPGGIVTWSLYEIFHREEAVLSYPQDAFQTIVPLISEERYPLILQFFEFIAGVAAHSGSNGLPANKVSRICSWFAFEIHQGSDGFDSGYDSFQRAADATQHLFFAYLRAMASSNKRPSNLPLILKKLLSDSRYPPPRSTYQHHSVLKISLLVDKVSPTPFALLKRVVRHRIYNDSTALAELYACADDPSKCLSDECARVLKCIGAVNNSLLSESQIAEGLADFTWSRFIDFGFDDSALSSVVNSPRSVSAPELSPSSRTSRPITPSWGEFLNDGFPSSHFIDSPLVLPPKQSLPNPISQKAGFIPEEPTESSDRGNIESVKFIDLDDAFWGVWIESLAAETVENRKSVFGRTVLVEISNAGWIIIEEKLRGMHSPKLLPPMDTKKRMFSKRLKARNVKPINSIRRPLSPELQVSPQLAEMLRERYAAQLGHSGSAEDPLKQTEHPVDHKESRMTLGTEIANAINWAGREGRYVTNTTEATTFDKSPPLQSSNVMPVDTLDENPFTVKSPESSPEFQETISHPETYIEDVDNKDKNRIFKLFLHRRKTLTVPKTLHKDPCGASTSSRSTQASEHNPKASQESLDTFNTDVLVRRKPVPSQMLLPYDATPGEESFVSSNSTTPRAHRLETHRERVNAHREYPQSQYENEDKSETSDEETIEDRVARIKKRVAELAVLSE